MKRYTEKADMPDDARISEDLEEISDLFDVIFDHETKITADPIIHYNIRSGKEAFEAVIDSQPLPPLVKLNKLLNYLEGPAKQALQGYRIVGRDYPTVRQAFKKQLGNTDASLHAELDNLTPAMIAICN